MNISFTGGATAVKATNNSGTNWQALATGKGIWIYDPNQTPKWVIPIKVYVRTATTWSLVCTTDKLISLEIPASPTIVVDHTLLLQKYVRVGWAESTNGLTYSLVINYYNNTDPTKNQTVTLNTGRTGTSYVFPTSAGVSGDTGCGANLYYTDGVFNGSQASTAGLTL